MHVDILQLYCILSQSMQLLLCAMFRFCSTSDFSNYKIQLCKKNNTLDGSVRGEINKYQTCVFHIVGVSKVSEALACISNIK